MNAIQQMMLKKVADSMKQKGITKTLIDWNRHPEHQDFFIPVSENEMIIDKQLHEFLTDFYNNNKHLLIKS